MNQLAEKLKEIIELAVQNRLDLRLYMNNGTLDLDKLIDKPQEFGSLSLDDITYIRTLSAQKKEQA